MLDFRAIGVWRPGQVRTTWVESSRPIIPELERHIDRAWNEALSRPGIHLFDGPMCRCERIDASEGSLRLELSPTSYKPFTGTNLGHACLAERFGANALANPVGLSCLLISNDDFLLLGRRNASVAYYPNRIHPFSGCLEPKEAHDPFLGIARELREELAHDDSDLAELICTGIAMDRSLKQSEMIFAARSIHDRAEIERRMDAEEHVGAWSSPASKIDGALRDTAQFTPIGVASVLLWGRARLGNEWFESHRP